MRKPGTPAVGKQLCNGKTTLGFWHRTTGEPAMGQQRLEDPREPNPLIRFEPYEPGRAWHPPDAAAHALSCRSTTSHITKATPHTTTRRRDDRARTCTDTSEHTASFPAPALSEAIFRGMSCGMQLACSAVQPLPELAAQLRGDFGGTS